MRSRFFFLFFVAIIFHRIGVWVRLRTPFCVQIMYTSRNRMNTDTLNDRMMICSNGPAVSPENTKDIDVIVELAFEHCSQARQRMQSRSHPGVLRPRAGGGVEVHVHDILSAADRDEEVNGHVRAVMQNASASTIRRRR